MERGTVISGAEKEVVDVGANDELPIEVVKVPSQSEYWSCLADTVLVGEV